MEELRRQRGDPAAENIRKVEGPRPYAASSRPRPADGSGLSPLTRRALLKVRTGRPPTLSPADLAAELRLPEHRAEQAETQRRAVLF